MYGRDERTGFRLSPATARSGSWTDGEARGAYQAEAARDARARPNSWLTKYLKAE